MGVMTNWLHAWVAVDIYFTHRKTEPPSFLVMTSCVSILFCETPLCTQCSAVPNSGVWVKNLNPIWSIMLLGASQWSINPTCCKPGGVILHENCKDDGPTMQVKLNENRSHKKRSKPGKRNGNHTAIYKTMAITEENFLLQ